MPAFTKLEDLVAAEEFVPDGVWLNLDPVAYFAQDALGSTDLIRLFQRKYGWWWSSRHNPDAVDVETAGRTYGSALHAIVLEGIDAYEGRFVAKPERRPGTIDTIDEMKAALRRGGFTLKAKPGQPPMSQWDKPDWLAAMRDNLPRLPVWSNIEADWRRRIAAGREEISALDDRMLRLMASIITDERSDNAEIRKVFAGAGDYPALAEVSIFKTLEDGTRRRWRLDRMFPRYDLDLKSLGNYRGRPLKFEVGDLIARLGYDIQRADYYDGRLAAYEHIAAGRIYGGTIEQRKWLARFPETFPTWDWVWLFYQKPDPKGQAPIVFPVWDDSWDPRDHLTPAAIRRYGSHKAARALRFYRESVAEFGLDKPWARVEELHYTDEFRGAGGRPAPTISLPNWIAEDDPATEAAYA